jgi:1-aminocyclopropane-1-carboxylate deaminase
MIAGFAGQDRPRRVIGIDASARLGETRAQVARIARGPAELIDLGRELREEEITVLTAGQATTTAFPSSPLSRRSG